jgi:hypothetical protein
LVSRGVCWAPKSGARGLLEWATDLWPYVNGKALTSGINLKEMESRDMLDIVHYFFEEDLTASSGEEVEAKTKIRTLIYRDMYNKPYNYGVSNSEQSYNYDTANDGYVGATDDTITDPLKPPVIPYTPTTEFNADSSLPFGNLLDAPSQ